MRSCEGAAGKEGTGRNIHGQQRDGPDAWMEQELPLFFPLTSPWPPPCHTLAVPLIPAPAPDPDPPPPPDYPAQPPAQPPCLASMLSPLLLSPQRGRASWVITGPFVSVAFAFFMFYTYGIPAGVLTLLICAAIDVATFYYNW
eukprot:764625-Hanusia_phi.AAC.8